MRHTTRGTRRTTAAAAVALAAALTASACSPAADDDSDSNGKNGRTTVTFRLWDPLVAKAYEKSFAAFEKQNKKISVKVETVPWDTYWTKLTTDIGAGDSSDIYWINSSNFGIYADNNQLLDVGTPLKSEVGNWQKSVTDLYTRKGKLWGVPQLWDSIAMFYNKDLVKKAGVDPAKLKWSPNAKDDTFLPAAKKLTEGTKQYAFNASNDPQAIYWDFVGSNGGTWQKGDAFAMNNPKTDQAVQYVADLINKSKVAPSAADTNDNGDKTRELFVQGKMAMFQSGPYNLKAIADGAKFKWGIAPMLEGPDGRVGVVHGVSAVGSAKTKHKKETLEVLKWLGSAEGQKPIAAGGFAFPGVVDAQQTYLDYWKKKGVDVQPFVDAAKGKTFPAPLGPKVQAGATAMESTLKEIWLGREPVVPGLKKAQEQGNKAIAN
jgi:multiple sugar transport system substrate-binding protein